MKIKSIRKAGPDLYRVLFKRWWTSNPIERYVIVDRVWIESLKKEASLITYRDTDKLAHDCRAHVEWMVRNDVEYFNNFPTSVNSIDLILKDPKI